MLKRLHSADAAAVAIEKYICSFDGICAFVNHTLELLILVKNYRLTLKENAAVLTFISKLKKKVVQKKGVKLHAYSTVICLR